MPSILKSVMRFIMSQDERIEQRLRGISRQKLKQHFAYLKEFMLGHVDLNSILEKLHNYTFLHSDLYNELKMRKDKFRVEILLKKVYGFTEEGYLCFLKELVQLGIDCSKLLNPGPTIPEDKISKYRHVTIETIQTHKTHIETQLEINVMLDLLVEYDVITFQDHDEIQDRKGRRRKTEALMVCVFAKSSDGWIIGLLYVIEVKGFPNLAMELTRPRPVSPISDLQISMGQTVRIASRLRAHPETEAAILSNHGAQAEASFNDVFNWPIHDLRPGSIYMLINISKEKFINTQKEMVHKIKALVENLLKDPTTAETVKEKSIFTVELDEMNGDSFLDTTFVKETILVNVGENAGNRCSRCLQKTVYQNLDAIIDEIDTDIIVETLNKCENVSEFIRHKCVNSKDVISRKERATLFVQFVVTHEEALQKFWDIFHENSDLELERVLCTECNGIPSIHTSGEEHETRKFEFVIDKDKTGNITVEMLDTEVATPKCIPGKQSCTESALEDDECRTGDTLMVAAIDLGTSYSGYAFSTVGSYKSNPLDICINQAWNAMGKRLISSKTPTCILLTKDKEFVSFGYEAESIYADIVMDHVEDDYLFFNRFKSSLHKTDVYENMLIEDVRGTSVEAITVFSLAIRALKDHLMTHISDQINIHETEIKWVLTVPALWSSPAKEFMRKSAERAGITKEQLLIAIESEVASVYLQTDRSEKREENLPLELSDDRYMIIDLGGGTVDISAHEIVQPGEFKDICPPSGGLYGGASVDDKFIEFLSQIVGPKVIKHLKQQYSSSYLDLLREFECAKRVNLSKKGRKMNFTIPHSALNEICKQYCHQTFENMIQQSGNKGKISVVGDKLRLDSGVMESFFLPTVGKITERIENVLMMTDKKEIRKIYLAGGFAQSTIVRENIKRAFPKKEIVSLNDPDVVVLKGAVLFGHKLLKKQPCIA